MCQGFLKKKIVLNTVKIFELFNIFCFLYTAVHFKHDFQNVKFQNEKDNVSKCHYIVALNFSKGWTLRIRTICQATAAITFKDNFFLIHACTPFFAASTKRRHQIQPRSIFFLCYTFLVQVQPCGCALIRQNDTICHQKQTHRHAKN